MLCLRSMPTVPPSVVCTDWHPPRAASTSRRIQAFDFIAQFFLPASAESSPAARIMPPFAPRFPPNEPRTSQRLLPALHRVGLRGTHLRVDLEPLPQAVPRPRGVRADPGARSVHGRDGDRLLAVQPLVAELEEPAARLRARG